MGQTNASRVQTREGAYTFISPELSTLLIELDQRLNGANIYLQLTRDGDNLVDNVTYYRDSGHTLKIVERQITRVTTTDGIKRISTITNIFYQDDGVTEDSRVSNTITRIPDIIDKDDGPFTTSEDIEP